jgi:3-phenylpropionate/trans-cinnamate dioxygenase ferredoxin reductase component
MAPGAMPDRRVDVLIVGGGLAGAGCAEELRERGFDGSVLVAGREPDPPYHRPPCSKGYLRGEEAREDTLYRPASFWTDRDVELRTRTSVLKLDPGAHTARLSSKEEVGYGRALLATGANVRRLPADGAELEGIHYLRALGNSDAIRRDAETARRAVLVGGSYIGSEVAASLTELGVRCALVMLEEHPLARGFGGDAGRFIRRALEEHDIAVHGGEELAGFRGDDGRVSAVVTKSGLELPADLVVIGAGVGPDVTLARAAGLDLGESGGVRCDEALRTSAPDVWAAGDLCEYDSPVHGRRLRVEHWDVALAQGRTAARSMLAGGEPHTEIPYFFSDLSDWVALEYVGPATAWDAEAVRGSFETGEFSVWYLDGDRVAGCLAVGRGDDLEHARRLLRAGTPVEAAALADVDRDLGTL